MSTSSVRSAARTLDARRYAETFACFVSRSSEYTAMMNRLAEAASTLPTTYSVLDIGAGTGTFLRDWKEHDETSMPDRYMAIEPNPKHVPLLRQTMAELNIEGDVLEESFDTLSTTTPQDKFDLVLFSHSLYWLPNPVECVKQALSWLKPNGIVLIFHQGPFAFYTLFHLFDPLLDRDVPIMPDHGLSSHELVNTLRESGLKPLLEIDAAHVDMTDLAESERDELLSFILQVEFGEVAEPLKSDIVQHLQAACVEIVDGKLLFHHPNVTIVLRKND